MGINNDNFIMLPTVDFCFKELMKDPKMYSCEHTGLCPFSAG